MLRNLIANTVHVNPRFLITHFISCLFYLSCTIMVKSQNPKQIHLLGYYMATWPPPSTKPAPYVNINACYSQKHFFLWFIKLKTSICIFEDISCQFEMAHTGPLSLSFFPDLLFSVICVIFLALPTPFTLITTFYFLFWHKKAKQKWVGESENARHLFLQTVSLEV